MANPVGTQLDPVSSRFSLLRMLEPDVLSAPHEHYHAVRSHEPVYWDRFMHAWVVTSYKECVTVLMQYSAERTPDPAYLEELELSFMKPFSEMMLGQMMFMDGARHTRLRKLCASAFSPGRMETLRTSIASTAHGLIDAVCASGTIDLVADFASPLPALVTAQLLGTPLDDSEMLHGWVLDIAEVIGNFQHHPDRVKQVLQSLKALRAYVIDQLARQREIPRQGLIHSLLTTEIEGEHLSDDEIVCNIIITMVGGHETTMNLISGGFLSLMREPACLQQLKQNPEIVGSAVEELLRYESPVQHTARIAPADGTLGAKSIRRGERVVVVLAAANRDPERFPDPDRLDLLRPDNRHLAFGWAAHFCFGAALARMQAQIAFQVLLSRLQQPRLIEQELCWRENAGLRGLERLQIAFHPALAYNGQPFRG